jgi:nicotinamidase-related amidase
MKTILAIDPPDERLRNRVRELESVLREAIQRRAFVQHTGPSIGGKCTEACVLCTARSLLGLGEAP